MCNAPYNTRVTSYRWLQRESGSVGANPPVQTHWMLHTFSNTKDIRNPFTSFVSFSLCTLQGDVRAGTQGWRNSWRNVSPASSTLLTWILKLWLELLSYLSWDYILFNAWNKVTEGCHIVGLRGFYVCCENNVSVWSVSVQITLINYVVALIFILFPRFSASRKLPLNHVPNGIRLHHWKYRTWHFIEENLYKDAVSIVFRRCSFSCSGSCDIGLGSVWA